MANAREGTGWLAFASILLIIEGIMRIIDAFWAFKYNDELQNLQALLFEDNLAAYGWVWLILGVLLIAAGVAILNAAQWARWFGILAGSVGAIIGISWIYVQPVWALVHITLAVLVIYALVVYAEPESTPV
jgi:hypothetical protein